MATALAGRSPGDLAYSDTLVFAPGALASTGLRAGDRSTEPLNPAREGREHELYSNRHCVFWAHPNTWTELANGVHWWEPAAEVFSVTFTTGHLVVERTAEMTGPHARRDGAAAPATELNGPLGQHLIKKIFVTKPTGFMWDRSDIHVVVDHDGKDLAVTVVGIEALTARRLAGRFAAATAQRRLQELEFIEEHDAEWLETVAFNFEAALELDWAWLYELPAHH